MLNVCSVKPAAAAQMIHCKITEASILALDPAQFPQTSVLVWAGSCRSVWIDLFAITVNVSAVSRSTSLYFDNMMIILLVVREKCLRKWEDPVLVSCDVRELH